MTLTAEKINSTTISTGKTVSEIVIANNADLQRLHETTMRHLRPHMTYDVDVSMLFNPPEVEEVSIRWIKGYALKHDDASLFHPHITVGFGSTEKFNFPITFSAKKLGLFQLGNNCTCRKTLAEFALKKP